MEQLLNNYKVTTFPVDHITSQTHQLPYESLVKTAQVVVSCERAKELKVKADKIKVRGQLMIKRVLDLAAVKRVISVADSMSSVRNGLQPD